MSDNESLHFVSSIDLQGLRADVAKIEQSLKGITSTAGAEAKKMDDTYSDLTKMVAGYFTVAFGAQLVSNIATVRGEFQKYEAVLTNSLGSSADAADSMKMIAKFAAETPFSLQELTGAYVKLVNQGFKPTEAEMTKMADLSASVGKEFGQLAEAVIDAQTGEFERLKEFGIKASKEGDNVTFSFKGVQTQVENTAANIQQYILSLGEMKGVAGATAAISATLTGQISNLGDAIGQMYNDMGADNEGLISDALSGVTALVNNYKTVLTILESMVVAYGAYKTAVIISSLTMKGLTIAENLHLIALMAKERALKIVTAAQLMFNNAAKMNPLGLVFGALVAVTGALLIYGNKSKELTLAQVGMARASENAALSFGKQKLEIDTLLSTTKNQALSDKQRLEAIIRLKEVIPGYTAELSKEGKIINENTAAIKDYLAQLEIQMMQEAIRGEMQELTSKKLIAQRELTKATNEYNSAVAKNHNTINSVAYGESGIEGQLAAIQDNARKLNAKESAEKSVKEVQDAMVSLQDELTSAELDIAALLAKTETKKGIPQTIAEIDKAIKQLREAQQQSKIKSEYDKLEKEILDWEAKKEKITGKKAAKTATTEEKATAKSELDLLKEEMAGNKDAYDKDLVCYGEYLDEKAKFVVGKKDQEKAVKEAQKDNDKEIASNLKDLVTKYASFEQQKKDVAAKYAAERLTLINAGKMDELAQLDKAEKEELKALNENHVKQTASYQYLFENIDKLSVDALKKRIERLKQDLALTATTAEERLAIEKALAEASDALISKAPMAALKQLGARAKELRAQINSAKTDAEKAPLQAELDGVTQKQGAALSTVFSDVSSRLSEAKTLAGLFGEELGQAVELASNIAGSFAQMASGNYVAGAIGLATTLISASKSWDAKQKANEEKKAQERVAASNELIAEANKLYSEQLDLLGRIRGVNIYGQIEATKDSLIASLTEANAAVEALSLKDKNQHYTTRDLKRTGWASVGYSTTNRWHDYNMSGLNDSLSSALNDPTFDKIQTAQAKIKEIKDLIANGTIFGDTDALKAQLDNYNELLKKAEELALKEAEIYTGSTYDSMVEAIASGFEDGTYTAEEFAKNFEDLMKKAILNALKIKWIEEPMKQWNAKFAEYMNDGVLTEDEAADLRTRMEKIKTDAAAGLEAINQAGIDLLGDAGTNAEGLSGAIQGMSQDSADLMAGQLGAMRIHLADIATAITGAFNADLKDAWKAPANVLGGGMATMNDNLALMRDTAFKANEYLAQIEVNTRRLGNIEALLGGNPTTTTPPRPNGYDKGFRDDRIMGR